MKKTREAVTSSLDTVKLWKKLFRIRKKTKIEILIILEILWNYYGVKSREGIETLKTMFRMPHDCLIFYCLSLDFFVVFQDKLHY